MENKSPTTGTFTFGTKHFQDLTLLKLMLDSLMKPLPSYEFVKETGQEAGTWSLLHCNFVLIVLIKNSEVMIENEKIWQTHLVSYNVFFHKFCQFSCFSVWEMDYTIQEGADDFKNKIVLLKTLKKSKM